MRRMLCIFSSNQPAQAPADKSHRAIRFAVNLVQPCIESFNHVRCHTQISPKPPSKCTVSRAIKGLPEQFHPRFGHHEAGQNDNLVTGTVVRPSNSTVLASSAHPIAQDASFLKEKRKRRGFEFGTLEILEHRTCLEKRSSCA